MFHGNPTLEIASGMKVLRDRIAAAQVPKQSARHRQETTASQSQPQDGAVQALVLLTGRTDH